MSIQFLTPARQTFDLELRDANGGLTLKGGPVLQPDGSVVQAAFVRVTLPSNGTTFVERTQEGAVSTNAAGFSDGLLPLYVVVTRNSHVVTVIDVRGLGDGVSSASGMDISSLGAMVAEFSEQVHDYGTPGAAPTGDTVFAIVASFF